MSSFLAEMEAKCLYVALAKNLHTCNCALLSISLPTMKGFTMLEPSKQISQTPASAMVGTSGNGIGTSTSLHKHDPGTHHSLRTLQCTFVACISH